MLPGKRESTQHRHQNEVLSARRFTTHRNAVYHTPMPSNIFFIGPTGAGKTTIGRRVAQRYCLEFFDLDQEIEQHTGADIALIFDIEGETGFRQRETAMLKELSCQEGMLLATGGGAILAQENQQILRTRGLVVYLATPIERQIERLRHDKRRPLLHTANPREILTKMALQRNPIYQRLADVVISSEAVSVACMASKVIQRLDRHRKQYDV